MTDAGRELPQRAIAALLWIAAFCFATGIFLSSTLLLRDLPPTPHVAVGRVTIENVSKSREYATVFLFFLIVPVATLALYRYGARVDASLRGRLAWRGGDQSRTQNLISLLFVAPFYLAPFLYLTTFKWGWPLLIPLLLSQVLPRAVILVQSWRWLRRLSNRDLAPFHALIVAEAFAWLLFRYIETVRRIAHIPTLFLEVVFFFFFVLVFWMAFAVIAHLSVFTIHNNRPHDESDAFEIAFKRVAVAGLPLVVLPILAIVFIPGSLAMGATFVAVLISMTIALRGGEVESSTSVRRIVAYAVAPLLLYCFSYASTASLSQWFDLFHRGESLGPASDYLRGKVPYRDVFVLHGLLYDGMLDAWLMTLFGRSAEVALQRAAILGSFASPALWYLGMVIFDSMPLSFVVMLLGAVTTVDNERAFFEITTLTLLLAATKGRVRPVIAALSGAVAGITIFYSFDIGLYSVGGALIYLGARRIWRAVPAFLAGVIAGALPFSIYLATRDAFGAFVETSFVTIPRIIDAVWSLPFPDMTSTFRQDLNLHTIADFLLFERFRYILNPLVICIGMVVFLQRAVRRKRDWLDAALLALVAFALLTQRSALGRADFPHQYFSAFLIGPMVLLLIVLFVRETADIWRKGGPAAQGFILLLAVASMPLLATALWVPDIVNMRLNDLLAYIPRVKKYVRDPVAEQVEGRIGSVGYHVNELSRRGSPIFDFSNQPAFYFFLNRPNPSRFYQVPIMSPPEFQRETIVALERARPALVLRRSPQDFDVFDAVDNDIRAQAVAAYLDDYYAFARSVRGVELWKRKAVAPPADVNTYLRHIRVPTLKEISVIGTRSRMVFPTIGSIPGANNSLWRSDLTLYNPHKQPMNVGLRYVAGDTRIDRRVILGAGRNIRWEDVVKSLFAGPDSRGVLWIEYRGERAPVARARTYDALRQAGGSVEAPLTAHDSATSGTDVDDLTVVGITGGGASARRVNIGVVNIGKIPATFRITAQSRTGQRAGRAIEQGLAEDESFFLADLDHRLGVVMDETTTLHVTMIAGTCIAYATIVDTDGDNHFIAAIPSPKP